MNILGIIPARGGSKEVPRKNLLKIGGKSLIELAIDSAIESKFLTKILLSSDDDEMIKEGNKINRFAPFKRPKNLATDTSSTFSVLEHAVNWLIKEENWETDIIVVLQPTTPFRKGHHIDSVVELLLKSKSNAAITIRNPDYTPYWMLNMDKNQKLTNVLKGGNIYKRRQDAPITFQPAGMVYAFKKNLIYEMDTIFPYKDTRGFFVSREDSINIDSYIDYELAKLIYEKKLQNEKL